MPNQPILTRKGISVKRVNGGQFVMRFQKQHREGRDAAHDQGLGLMGKIEGNRR